MTQDITRAMSDVPRSGLFFREFLLALFILAIGGFTHWQAVPNHDVSWLVTAAGRMLNGGTYRTDFFEVNMPLAIAVYTPICALLALTGLKFQAAVTVYVSVLALQSACLSAFMLTEGGTGRSRRGLVTAALLTALLILPGTNFGQKEHLVVLLSLPFVCSMANPRSASQFNIALRCYVTALAAAGFFIKPHYAVLPLAILAGRALQERAWRPLFAAESRVFLLGAVCNAAWVVLRYPDWFEVARWASDLYRAMNADSWQQLFMVTGAGAYALVLMLEFAALVKIPGCRSLMPFAICIIYAWLAYFVQLKGWDYQFLPVVLFSAAGAVCLLSVVPDVRERRHAHAAGALGLAAILSIALEAVTTARQGSDPALEGVPQPLSIIARAGDRVYPFSMRVWPLYPAMTIVGVEPASRYSHLWPLWGLAHLEQDLDDQGKAVLESRYRQPLIDSVIDDFLRFQPKWVLVDRTVIYPLPRNFNILARFLDDARFAEIWRHYKSIGGVRDPSGGRFEFFELDQGATAAAKPGDERPSPAGVFSDSGSGATREPGQR